MGDESFINGVDRLVILLLKIILFTKWSPKFTKVWYWASHFEQVWHATLLMAKSVTLEIMFIIRCGSRDKSFLRVWYRGMKKKKSVALEMSFLSKCGS